MKHDFTRDSVAVRLVAYVIERAESIGSAFRSACLGVRAVLLGIAVVVVAQHGGPIGDRLERLMASALYALVAPHS